MALWVVISMTIHLIITMGVALTATRYSRPALLQVELRTAVAEDNEPLAIAGAVPEFDLPSKPQDAARPEINSPGTQPPSDTPKTRHLPMDIYYASGEVDKRAEPMNEVDLVYPLGAYQQRIRGTVRLDIFVNEQGGIDKVAVIDSKPPGVFEEAALQAVAALKFSPAIKNGVPVKNRKAIEVTFDPYEKISTP